MADLPTVNAVNELKEQVTIDRQALQKSMRAGLLNVVKSVDRLHTTFENAFRLQQEMLDLQAQTLIAAREKEIEDARKKDKKEPSSAMAAMTKELGGFGSALAIALGGLVGAVKGQLIAIQAFGKTFTPFVKTFVKTFTPNRLLDAYKRMKNGLDILKVYASAAGPEIVEALKGGVKNFGQSLLKFVKAADTGLFADVFKRLKTYIKPLIDVFVDAGKTIKSISAGPAENLKKYFGMFKDYFGKFGSTLGKIASVVGKIFAPIAIIMVAIDTVRGIIDGYAEGGFLGAIQEGIKAFFNSLIFKPLDMLKSLISSVLEFFGASGVAEALDSFSFEEIFSNLIDAIFSPIETAKKIFSAISEFLTSKVDAIKNSSAFKFFFGDDDENKEAEQAAEELNKKKEETDKKRAEAAKEKTEDLKEEDATDRDLTEAERKSFEERRKQQLENKKRKEAEYAAAIAKAKAEREAAQAAKEEANTPEKKRQTYQKGLDRLFTDQQSELSREMSLKKQLMDMGIDPEGGALTTAGLKRGTKEFEDMEKAMDIKEQLARSQRNLDRIDKQREIYNTKLANLDTQSGATAGGGSNINVNATTNNTSAVNKTTSMPASASRQGGAQYKTAAGFG